VANQHPVASVENTANVEGGENAAARFQKSLLDGDLDFVRGNYS